MKNKLFRIGMIALVAALATACQKKEETPVVVAVDKDQVKKDIQATEDAYAVAFNAHNAEGISYYSDDARSFSNEQGPAEGKAAITARIKEELAAFPKDLTIAFSTDEVHPSNDGNQVVEIGSYTVMDSVKAKKMSGHFISLFEKRDGKYLCIRDMAVSDSPKPKKE